jgi:hypothetical protein
MAGGWGNGFYNLIDGLMVEAHGQVGVNFAKHTWWNIYSYSFDLGNKNNCLPAKPLEEVTGEIFNRAPYFSSDYAYRL